MLHTGHHLDLNNWLMWCGWSGQRRWRALIWHERKDKVGKKVYVLELTRNSRLCSHHFNKEKISTDGCISNDPVTDLEALDECGCSHLTGHVLWYSGSLYWLICFVTGSAFLSFLNSQAFPKHSAPFLLFVCWPRNKEPNLKAESTKSNQKI